MRNLIAISLVVLGAAGCARPEPPSRLQEGSFSQTFEASHDEVWKALIDSTSESFFAIRSFEKDSGLLTLEFATNRPSLYATCGKVKGTEVLDNIEKQEGAWLSKVRSDLKGVANLTVREVSPQETRVRVNARMILDMTDITGRRHNVSFGTTERGFLINMPCTSDGTIESSILAGVRDRLKYLDGAKTP